MSIKVENLTHIYNESLAFETKAIDDVTFEIPTGEFAGIIGHTGSGKSTLIQHLNGILKPKSGTITINDTIITSPDTKMPEVRKKIGLVFQYPEYQLFEETVYKDVAFGPENLGLEEEEIDRRVRESLALVGVDFEEFSERSPFELSGGQKRRVAIAGVIAMEPELLILDEPTAGLDPNAHKNILNMIRNIKDRREITVILVSHNMDDIARLADRVFVMHKGKLIKSGTPREIFKNPEELNAIGLDVPSSSAFAAELNSRGFNIGNVLTIDELADEIVAAQSTPEAPAEEMKTPEAPAEETKNPEATND